MRRRLQLRTRRRRSRAWRALAAEYCPSPPFFCCKNACVSSEVKKVSVGQCFCCRNLSLGAPFIFKTIHHLLQRFCSFSVLHKQIQKNKNPNRLLARQLHFPSFLFEQKHCRLSCFSNNKDGIDCLQKSILHCLIHVNPCWLPICCICFHLIAASLLPSFSFVFHSSLWFWLFFLWNWCLCSCSCSCYKHMKAVKEF